MPRRDGGDDHDDELIDNCIVKKAEGFITKRELLSIVAFSII